MKGTIRLNKQFFQEDSDIINVYEVLKQIQLYFFRHFIFALVILQ